MKNKLLLLLSLIALSGFSQNAPINFETSGNGATWNWITFNHTIHFYMGGKWIIRTSY